MDLSSGQLSEAIIHAEKALESVEARLAELRNGVSGQMKVETLPDKSDPKGKGKAPARGPRLLGSDAIQGMTQAQMEAEVKELEGLKGDLAAKVRRSFFFSAGGYVSCFWECSGFFATRIP